MLKLAGYSSSLINHVSFQLLEALDGQSLGSIQCPHREILSYVGRKDQTMFELKLGQNGVKAGGEVQGGFGYQVSVTRPMSPVIKMQLGLICWSGRDPAPLW